jgi:hypothetical protein
MVLEDGSLYASAANITGTIHATDGEFTGTINANNGNIGAFEITNDGLSSEYITLNSQSIYFPTQASFNLANYVSIFHDNTQNISYIATTGDRDFEIKNMGGAGIRFEADKVGQTVYQEIKITPKYDGYIPPIASPLFPVNYHIYFDFSIKNNGVLIAPYNMRIYFKANEQYAAHGYRERSGYVDITIPVGLSSGTCVQSYIGNGGANNITVSSSADGIYDSYTTITSVNINTTNNILYSLGSFCPNITATESSGYLLGDANHLWRNLTAYSATITTSDRNEKHNIKILSDEFERFYDDLKPVSFVYNHADSNRTHIGFIAQDVEDGLIKHHIDTQYFAGICIDEDKETGNKKYFLRYEEFIPLNTLEIQKLKVCTAELESYIKTLEERISQLENK